MDTVNCTLVCYPHVQTEAVGQSVPMSEFMSFPPERLEVKDARPGGGWRPAKEPEPKGWTGGAAEPRGHVASLRTTEQRSRGLYTCLWASLYPSPCDSRGKRRGRSGSARRRRPLVVPHLETNLRRIWTDLRGASGPTSGASGGISCASGSGPREHLRLEISSCGAPIAVIAPPTYTAQHTTFEIQ